MDKEKIKKEIEIAVGNLFASLYRLRHIEEYEEEYDLMGILIKMLQEDRQHLLSCIKSKKVSSETVCEICGGECGQCGDVIHDLI